MRKMDPFEHARRTFEKWKGWKFPDPQNIPEKPWHPDGDVLFRTEPRRKVDSSDQVMEYLATTGSFKFGTGDPKPDSSGKTGGIYLNRATASDPAFTISKDAGSKKLWCKLGYSAPYGSKVRIPKNAIAQGYPMNEYSDHKMHIYDEVDRTITEIQYIEEVKSNPIVSFLLSLFGKGTGGYSCHGVQQYSLDVPSTDESVVGSTAARIPNAASTLRYDDLVKGYASMSTMAVPMAHKALFIPPAHKTDGRSSDPFAIKMGELLKLTDASYEKLKATYGSDVVAATILESWYVYGIMVIDTGGHISTSLEPDNRFDQEILGKLAEDISLDDFEVWEH